MSRPRIYLRSEGWYFLFVALFVLGGAVLRHVNLLVALAGLMAAALLIHYQLLVQALSRLDVLRILPPRICAGDVLEVEIAITHRHKRGAIYVLEFREEVVRIDPPTEDAPEAAAVLFPVVEPKAITTRRYACLLTRRGIYQFAKAELLSRYPFGLLEGCCRLDLPDQLVVCPRLGQLHASWRNLLDAEHDGQQRSRHRRGLLEADFYALREWRNGDSRRWIHWRTSAKLGTLSVRQFEQRRSCELVLVCDLWQPGEPTAEQAARVEEVVSFAATAVTDLARHGGAQLTFVLAGKGLRLWHAAASSLFAQEMLEQLATCEASFTPELLAADRQLNEYVSPGTRVIVLSTRPRPPLSVGSANQFKSIERLHEARWLDCSAGDFDAYFSLEEEAFSA